MNGIVVFRTLLGNFGRLRNHKAELRGKSGISAAGSRVNLKAGVEALPGTAVGSVLSACSASCEALLALVQFLATAKQCNFFTQQGSELAAKWFGLNQFQVCRARSVFAI